MQTNFCPNPNSYSNIASEIACINKYTPVRKLCHNGSPDFGNFLYSTGGVNEFVGECHENVVGSHTFDQCLILVSKINH